MRIAVLISAACGRRPRHRRRPRRRLRRRPRRPLPRGSRGRLVKGEAWIDYEHQLDPRRPAERRWQDARRVCADLDHDGDARRGRAEGRRRDRRHASRSPSTRACSAARTASTSASRCPHPRTRRGTSRSSAWPRPPAACATSRSTRARRRPASTFPIVGPGQINGLIWDDKDDDGHREAGEDGVEQLARLPRRRPRRRARRRRARTRTRPTSPASTSCPMPTRYVVAGGELPPLVLERRDGVDCSAPSECAVTGLRVRPSTVTTAEHGVARPVVIFVHGYGGSRIACGNKPLWFSCSATSARRPGPVGHAAGPRRPRAQRADGGTECSRDRRRRRPAARRRRRRHLRRRVGPLQGHRLAGPRTTTTCGTGASRPRTRSPGLDALVEKARCGGEPPCDSRSCARLARRALDGRARDPPLHRGRRAGRQGPADRDRRHAVLGLAEDDLPGRRRRRGADVLRDGRPARATAG